MIAAVAPHHAREMIKPFYAGSQLVDANILEAGRPSLCHEPFAAINTQAEQSGAKQ